MIQPCHIIPPQLEVDLPKTFHEIIHPHFPESTVKYSHIQHLIGLSSVPRLYNWNRHVKRYMVLFAMENGKRYTITRYGATTTLTVPGYAHVAVALYTLWPFDPMYLVVEYKINTPIIVTTSVNRRQWWIHTQETPSSILGNPKRSYTSIKLKIEMKPIWFFQRSSSNAIEAPVSPSKQFPSKFGVPAHGCTQQDEINKYPIISPKKRSKI